MSLVLARRAFIDGYRIGLLDGDPRNASEVLRSVAALGLEGAPFAHEGVAMAWTVLDARTSDRGPSHVAAAASTRHPLGGARVGALLAEADEVWHPFLQLGVGCGLARLGRDVPDEPSISDGYGFQHGLGDRGWAPRDRRTSPWAERGRGRALWFTTEGDVDVSRRLVARAGHAEEWWRGIATACVFAGDPRGHAARLPDAAAGREAALAAGAGEALRLWRTLGRPPRRVCTAASALGT